MGRRKYKVGAAYADLTGKEVSIPLEAVPPRAQGALEPHGKLLAGVVQGPDSVHPGCVVVKLRVKGPSPGSQPLKLFFRADLVRSWLELPSVELKGSEVPEQTERDAEPEQRPSKKAKHTTPGAHALHDESCPAPIASRAELPAVTSQADAADSDSTVHEAKHIVRAQQSVLANTVYHVPSELPMQFRASTESLQQERNSSLQAAGMDAQQMEGLEGPGLCANDAASDPSQLVILQPPLEIPVQTLTTIPSSTPRQFTSDLVRRYVLGESANFQAHQGTSDHVLPIPPLPQFQTLHSLQPEPVEEQKQVTAAISATIQKGSSGLFNILREALRQPTRPISTSAGKQVRHSRPANSPHRQPLPEVSNGAAQTADHLSVDEPTSGTPEAVTARQESLPAHKHTHIQLSTVQAYGTDDQQPMAALPAHKYCASQQPNMQQLPGGLHGDQGPQTVDQQSVHATQAASHAQGTQEDKPAVKTQQDKQKPGSNDAHGTGTAVQPAPEKLSNKGVRSRSATPSVTDQRPAVKWGKPVKGHTKKHQVADIQGKVFYIPGPVFGVDVPDFYYRAKVIGPDKGHKDAAVIMLIGDDLKNRFFFPTGQIREWIAESEGHAGVTGVRSDEFAAEVLAAMHAGVDPSESNTMSHSREGSDPQLQRHASVGTK